MDIEELKEKITDLIVNYNSVNSSIITELNFKCITRQVNGVNYPISVDLEWRQQPKVQPSNNLGR